MSAVGVIQSRITSINTVAAGLVLQDHSNSLPSNSLSSICRITAQGSNFSEEISFKHSGK